MSFVVFYVEHFKVKLIYIVCNLLRLSAEIKVLLTYLLTTYLFR